MKSLPVALLTALAAVSPQLQALTKDDPWLSMAVTFVTVMAAYLAPSPLPKKPTDGPK